jgi:hypothetical protein
MEEDCLFMDNVDFMTYKNVFSYWPFTSSHCVEKLMFAGGDNPSLSYNLEWISLGVETFAVEHSKGASLSENIELLSGIAASLDSVPNKHLMDAMTAFARRLRSR